jgi:hypothetical protein
MREFELGRKCFKALKFSNGCSILIFGSIASEKVLMLGGTAGRVSSSPQQTGSCCKKYIALADMQKKLQSTQRRLFSTWRKAKIS